MPCSLFSATLLVVSLEVPDSFPELVAELKGFIAFGIRFGVLVTLWTVHNAFFRRYPIADRTITFLNALFLFVILFYVYPLKFLTESIVAPFIGEATNRGMNSLDDLALLFTLYSLGFVAVFGSIALMYRHVYRTRASLELSAFSSPRSPILRAALRYFCWSWIPFGAFSNFQSRCILWSSWFYVCFIRTTMLLARS